MSHVKIIGSDRNNIGHLNIYFSDGSGSPGFKKPQQTHLCENPILSVVLLQDVLEGKLDFLLELLHLHLLLEPGSIWRVNCHISFFFFFLFNFAAWTAHVPSW